MLGSIRMSVVGEDAEVKSCCFQKEELEVFHLIPRRPSQTNALMSVRDATFRKKQSSLGQSIISTSSIHVEQKSVLNSS